MATSLQPPPTPPAPSSHACRRPETPCVHSFPPEPLPLTPATNWTTNRAPPSPWFEARVANVVHEPCQGVHRLCHRRLRRVAEGIEPRRRVADAFFIVFISGRH